MGKYSYSVERAEFALLNKDGSLPTPKDWTHTVRKTGVSVSHRGGIIGGVGPWDFSALTGDDLKVSLIYGKDTIGPVTLEFDETPTTGNVVDSAAVTAAELAAILGAAFTTQLTASVTTVGSDYSAAYLKLIDKGTLPWYAPFGFRGKVAEMAEIVGWMSTGELKSSSAEPNVETGETVTATSGKGVRCSIKEPDTVTGKKLTISLAADEEEILSMIYGDDFDPSTGEYFERDASAEAPTFAYRAWIRRYPSGDNVKTSQDEMKVRVFPSCSGTPGSSTDEESTFAAIEISADCASNSRSTLPSEHRKTISVTNFQNYVEA